MNPVRIVTVLTKRPFPASDCPKCGAHIIGVIDEEKEITCRGCGKYLFITLKEIQK